MKDRRITLDSWLQDHAEATFRPYLLRHLSKLDEGS